MQISKPKKNEDAKKRLSIERIYQKKTQLEHILLRPDTYIGSVELVTQVNQAGCGFPWSVCAFPGEISVRRGLSVSPDQPELIHTRAHTHMYKHTHEYICVRI